MAAPVYFRSPFGLAKRLKIAPPRVSSQCRSVYKMRQPFNAEPSPMIDIYRNNGEEGEKIEMNKEMHEALEKARGTLLPLREYKLPPEVKAEVDELRLPRAVQLTYLNPLKRKAKWGIPMADLQLRSYSVRNLDFMTDFALRAAYYLNLPARGPIPLPRITERYTVPKSNFVHKKSQENFERITMRRLVQIQDGHPEVVQIWLGFLAKYTYHGVGMKANVWDHGSADVGQEMDKTAEEVEAKIKERLELFGRRKDLVGKRDVKHLLHDKIFKGAYGSMGPLGASQYRAV